MMAKTPDESGDNIKLLYRIVNISSNDDDGGTTSNAPFQASSSQRNTGSSSHSVMGKDKKLSILPSSTAELDMMKDGKGGNPPLPDTSSTSSSMSVRLLLLVTLVFWNSAIVLVGRYTRSSALEENVFVVNDLILVTEVVKFFGSIAFEAYTTRNLVFSLRQNIVNKPMDCLRMSIPGLLYLVQNSLSYAALSSLSAPLFQVTRQIKLLTTALVSVSMLGRRYKGRQWICLMTLSIGVVVVVLSEDNRLQKEFIEVNNGSSLFPPSKRHVWKGLVQVTLGCLASAFAGVYVEKVLKKPGGNGTQEPVSLWIRNMQLAFFSIGIALVQILQEKTVSRHQRDFETKPFLHGFTSWVWVLVFLHSGGGLLMAAVIKYADNVLQGLAIGVAVAVSAFASTVIFGTQLAADFFVGTGIIILSVYFFSVDPCTSTRRATCRKMLSNESAVGNDTKSTILPTFKQVIFSTTDFKESKL